MKSVVNLLNEVGMLSNLPRSGFAFLGSGKQSVAEHSFRVAHIAYALAKLSKTPVNMEKLLLLCLFHDLPEARIGDLNNVNKRYVKSDEKKVIDELKHKGPLGPEVAGYITEFEEQQSHEAILARDADQLELLLVLKELHDTGNPRAMEWYKNCVKRLKTKEAHQLAETISQTPSDEWWTETL